MRSMDIVKKDESLKVLATNVQKCMDERDMSIRELARRSENHPNVIMRLVRAEGMPSADAVHRISESLGVSLDSLFEKKRAAVA